jgi:RNA polymerase sigma-70 factor (ECF subfamily)
MPGFEQIYTEYFDDVYRYVYSLSRSAAVAEEVTQDTFFKALRSIDSFRGDCKLRVWLCQIAKNTYLTSCKKTARAESLEALAREQTGDIAEDLVNRDNLFAVHKALHNLEEPYKEVFSLRIFGELSFSTIGELFGKTEGWARVTYHRAKIKVKENIR